MQLSIYRKLTAGSNNRRLRWHRLHGLSSEVKASIDGGVIIRKLHRHGNEAAWWANQQIAPIEVAKELWETTLYGSEVRPARPRDVPDSPAAK